MVPIFNLTREYKVIAAELTLSFTRTAKNGVCILGQNVSLFEKEFAAAIKKLEHNDGLILNLAMNYGGRQDLMDAVNELIGKGSTSVTEEDISARLSTAGLPDPDLLIRTSGESRLSNFLLWQSAYAEFYVTPVLWPDFRRPQLHRAIADYQSRHRRFGGL